MANENVTGGIAMKYDVLQAYKCYLLDHYCPTTAQTYYNCLENLLVGQSIFYTIEKLDISKILYNLSKIRYKSYFSQYKNALFHFLTFQNITLSNEQLETIKSLEKCTHKKYRKQKEKSFYEIDKEIRNIKNNKMRLSYQVLMYTGLRVSELSQITTHDTYITSDTIQFSFTGKGGKRESVILSKIDHDKLFHELCDHIKTTKDDKKIFYSANYLQANAKKNFKFSCHDLRRIYAKQLFAQTQNKQEVKEKLRHQSIKTTKIYLNSKIKMKGEN